MRQEELTREKHAMVATLAAANIEAEATKREVAEQNVVRLQSMMAEHEGLAQRVTPS
jgi:hypothetical protein